MAYDVSPDDVAAARLYMRAMARFWVGGTAGRGKFDPIYVQITEGRDGPGPEQRKHYSSCGDLPQALCQHMGAEGSWVNRAGYLGWTPGKNLTDFYSGKDSPAESTPLSYLPEAGDIGFIWLTGNDAHTLVFGNMINADHIETFNFGAGGMSPGVSPGAVQAASKLAVNSEGLYVGTRILHKVLTVPKLLSLIDPGKLPPMSGEVIDEIEARIT